MKTYMYPSFSISGRSVWTATTWTILYLVFTLLVRSDVMLRAQAFNKASKMGDIQVVLAQRFLL